MMQIKEKFPNIKKFNPKTPDIIEKIIYKAVSKDPKDRYPSAENMRKELERIIRNPELLEQHSSFFFNLFHSSERKRKKEEKMQKKALKEAAKENRKEEERHER